MRGLGSLLLLGIVLCINTFFNGFLDSFLNGSLQTLFKGSERYIDFFYIDTWQSYAWFVFLGLCLMVVYSGVLSFFKFIFKLFPPIFLLGETYLLKLFSAPGDDDPVDDKFAHIETDGSSEETEIKLINHSKAGSLLRWFFVSCVNFFGPVLSFFCFLVYMFIFLLNADYGFVLFNKGMAFLGINHSSQEVCHVNLPDDYVVFDQDCYPQNADCDGKELVWGMDQMNITYPNKIKSVVLEKGAALLTHADIVYAKSGSFVGQLDERRAKAIFFEEGAIIASHQSAMIPKVQCDRIELSQTKPKAINVPVERTVDIALPSNSDSAIEFHLPKMKRNNLIFKRMPFDVCIDRIYWEAEGLLSGDSEYIFKTKIFLFDKHEELLDTKKIRFSGVFGTRFGKFKYGDHGKAMKSKYILVKNFCFSGISSPGEYYFKVVLDVDNEVQEIDENNNSFIFPFDIKN